MEYQHSLEFKVRDYECDMQGVVNNGVYQGYLEHARHEFLQVYGIDFANLTSSGIHLVVVQAQLDYRKPLKSKDKFNVCSNLNRASKLRFEFIQNVYRIPDNTVMLNARIIGTALNHRGRPFIPEQLEILFR